MAYILRDYSYDKITQNTKCQKLSTSFLKEIIYWYYILTEKGF